MSDGTTINQGTTGDTIFSEDVSADPIGGFSGKIQGAKFYHGLHGDLGVPASDQNPLPVNDSEVVTLLEDLLEEFSTTREILEDGVLGRLSIQNDSILVEDGTSIAFGQYAASDGDIRFGRGFTMAYTSGIDGGNRAFFVGSSTTEDVYIGDLSGAGVSVGIISDSIVCLSKALAGRLTLNSSGLTLSSLAGVGSRTVVADANGKLSAP